jgi:hypothetical protein
MDAKELENEVKRLHIKLTLLERYLKTSMELPILGLDSTGYEKELGRILAKEGVS